MSDDVIASLTAAVAAMPDDATLRTHLAHLLIQAGRREEAIGHAAQLLAKDPTSAQARELMAAAMGQAGQQGPTAPLAPPAPPPEPAAPSPSAAPPTPHGPAAPYAGPPAPTRPDQAPAYGGFDWGRAESDFAEVAPPMFVDGSDEGAVPAWLVEQAGVRLADVGGMEEVKKRLEASFLAPLRNPDLRRLYGKSLRGGMLLYGPPGCGKTFIARAIAGELGAGFMSVALSDILDMYIGASERNVHEMFEQARAAAPCVLFLDEIDALAQKRSQTFGSGARGIVNQLLTELDGVSSQNDGVYVLAASNHPWDIDSALLRPGRIDRRLLVLPPDQPARESILRYHLRQRPVAGIDTRRIAKATDGYSGADLAHLCDGAAEFALMDSVASGTPRMIEQRDLEAALAQTRPSIGPWLETARNVALYANPDGEYDELARYLRRHKR